MPLNPTVKQALAPPDLLAGTTERERLGPSRLQRGLGTAAGAAESIFGGALSGVRPAGAEVLARRRREQDRIAAEEEALASEQQFEREQSAAELQASRLDASRKMLVTLAQEGLKNPNLPDDVKAGFQNVIDQAASAGVQSFGLEPGQVGLGEGTVPEAQLQVTDIGQRRGVIDKVTGEFRDVGQKPVTQEEVGGPGDFTKANRDKLRIRANDVAITTENLNNSLVQLQDFVRSENFVGGVTGSALQTINSIGQQLAQLTGTEDLFINQELNVNQIDKNMSDENKGFLRSAAISGDVREAATGRLAFIIAKSLNPDGKISDADVQAAREIISGSADRQSTLLKIQNIIDTTTRDANNEINRLGRLSRGGDPFEPISPPGKRGAVGEGKPLGDLSDEDFLNSRPR